MDLYNKIRRTIVKNHLLLILIIASLLLIVLGIVIVDILLREASYFGY